MNAIRLFFLLLFLQLISHSTCVFSHSKVEFLPGFNGRLPFSLKTGYIGVDEGEEVQLFYYLLESENNPKEDPLLLWFTGGPSCSTISAILYEIGPLQFEEMKYNGSLPRLFLRQYSWTKVANILFVDFPVGTGFSYATTSRANYSGDLMSSRTANQLIRKWLNIYPEFQSNSLYIGGDSYSGFTLPLYVVDMLRGNEEGMKPFLNIKGYLLGNPSTDKELDTNHLVPFAHGMGLVSDELFQAIKTSCNGQYRPIGQGNTECVKNFKAFEAGINGIQTAMILEEFCGRDRERPRRISMENIITHLQFKQFGAFTCRKDGYDLAMYWLNDWSVQQALHIRKGKIVRWSRCNYDLKYSWDITSSIKYHAILSAKGLPSIIYSGDHDLIVPFSSTQEWIRSLNYSITDDWRRWWVDWQIAGFTRTYSNRMTFATIKGAGHTAPEYKPKQSFAMFKRWLHGIPL